MPDERASMWAREKCRAANEATDLVPKEMAPAQAVARISTAVALAAKAATPTRAPAMGAPRSVVSRKARVVGDATSMRAAGTESRRIQARSLPAQVVDIRRRLDMTRDPATTG